MNIQQQRKHLDALWAGLLARQEAEREAFAKGLLIFNNVAAKQDEVASSLDHGFQLAPWMQPHPRAPYGESGEHPPADTQEIMDRLARDLGGRP